ncbi:flagellar FliL protein/chemotaxis protein MotB [Clostridium sp. USBA 49]|uniref:flagellar basal body-associated FliL family protein n=1 Tax=Clostridium TaxID=1485 RepID=UPI000999C522|nr:MULTISPECIES: flagellar basal body-associated FliL family protein [Clostridium]SKA72663.1 flagellar FliL protein/chemotaxis protein MotB [Clostridium sp. USBA 49]
MAEKNSKGNKGFNIIIIILLVIIIFALGFVGFLFIKNGSLNQNTNKDPQAINTVSKQSSSNETSTYTYSLDEFLVNLADDNSKRFFKAKIFIGYETDDKKKMDKELEEKVPILRDTINTILRSKKSIDITTKDKVDALKKEIIDKINPYFNYGKINNIYFYEILVQ